jgi:hypothetical protein
MPIIDFSRQTDRVVDVGYVLDVNGTLDVVKDGLQIDTVAITITAAEANILDGATLSTAELNFVDGVTSSIQTQIDNILNGTTPFNGDVSIGISGTPKNLVVWGDLTVLGSNTIIDTEVVQVEDPIMQLNYTAGSPNTGTDGGLEIGRNTQDNAQFVWKQGLTRWQFGLTTALQNVVGPSTTDTFTNKSIDTDSNTLTIGTMTYAKKVATNSEVNNAFNALDTAWQDLDTAASGKGANMIKIEDAAAQISATTVEGALAENRAAIDILEATTWTSTAGNGLTGNNSGTLLGGIDFTFTIPDGTYTTVGADTFDVDTSVLYAHLDDQAMTWTALQTFSVSPIVPTPTLGTHAVNKTYVDTHAMATWFGALTNAPGVYTTSTTSTVAGYNIHTDFETAGTADDNSKFLIFVNGQATELAAITSISNSGSNIVITFNSSELNYTLFPADEVMIWGPLTSTA